MLGNRAVKRQQSQSGLRELIATRRSSKNVLSLTAQEQVNAALYDAPIEFYDATWQKADAAQADDAKPPAKAPPRQPSFLKRRSSTQGGLLAPTPESTPAPSEKIAERSVKRKESQSDLRAHLLQRRQSTDKNLIAASQQEIDVRVAEK